MRLPLDEKRMRLALERLDAEVDQPARLVIGGGAAMILAYGHTLATQDVDAFAAKGGATIAELDAAAKRVAAELRSRRTGSMTSRPLRTSCLPTTRTVRAGSTRGVRSWWTRSAPKTS